MLWELKQNREFLKEKDSLPAPASWNYFQAVVGSSSDGSGLVVAFPPPWCGGPWRTSWEAVDRSLVTLEKKGGCCLVTSMEVACGGGDDRTWRWSFVGGGYGGMWWLGLIAWRGGWAGNGWSWDGCCGGCKFFSSPIIETETSPPSVFLSAFFLLPSHQLASQKPPFSLTAALH